MNGFIAIIQFRSKVYFEQVDILRYIPIMSPLFQTVFGGFHYAFFMCVCVYYTCWLFLLLNILSSNPSYFTFISIISIIVISISIILYLPKPFNFKSPKSNDLLFSLAQEGSKDIVRI
jgi:hypothetical protein